jgi:hypothetical protein
MNKLMVFCIALLMSLLSFLSGSAQNRNFQNRPGPQRERIDAQKIAFITDKLQLTPEEAQKMWPVYNKYNTQKEDLNKDFMKNAMKFRGKEDTMTDKDATELSDAYILHAQKMVDIQKDFHIKLKDVLPPKKILMLYNVEREFQKLLLQRLGQPNKGNRQQQQ